jgi:hypothetical protein
MSCTSASRCHASELSVPRTTAKCEDFPRKRLIADRLTPDVTGHTPHPLDQPIRQESRGQLRVLGVLSERHGFAGTLRRLHSLAEAAVAAAVERSFAICGPRLRHVRKDGYEVPTTDLEGPKSSDTGPIALVAGCRQPATHISALSLPLVNSIIRSTLLYRGQAAPGRVHHPLAWSRPKRPFQF